MSLESFGFAQSGGSNDAPVDLAAAAATAAAAAAAAAVVPTSRPSTTNVHQQHEKVQEEEEDVDFSKYKHNPKLTAYTYTHGGWLRHTDGLSALCPVPGCKTIVRTSGNTTNLVNHTSRKHPDIHAEHVKHQAQLAAESTGVTQKKLQFTPTAAAKNNLTRALAEFVILDLQPVNVVDADSLQNLLRVVSNDSSLMVPSRPKVTDEIDMMAANARDKIRQILRGKRPSLTTDMWTSNAGDSFMAITSHFIPQDEPKLTSITLSCKQFTGQHSAQRIADHLEEVMKEFGIEDSVVALTTDTAANIKCAGTKLLRMEWIPCACHLLQLCALKILNEPSVKKTFAKHNSLSGHLHHSTSSSEKLKKLQEAAGKPPKAIPTTTVTRWNSHFDQAVVIQSQKFVILQLCDGLKAEKKLDLTYNDGDWVNTAAVIEVLQLLARATKVMQGENFITSSTMAMTASMLHVLCITKACQMDLPPHIRVVAEKMFDDVEDRFYPVPDAFMIASVCDARLKHLPWCNNVERKMYHKITVRAMLAVGDEQTADTELIDLDEQDGVGEGGHTGATDAPAEKVPSRKDHRRKEKVDEGSLLFSQLLKTCALACDDVDEPAPAPMSAEARLAQNRRAAEYELDRYLAGPGLTDGSSAQSVLNWWSKRKMVFPTLFKVACVYLAVPASSGSSERVFSTAGNVVTKKRNRLGTDSVSNLVFLHGCHGVGWNMGDPSSRIIKKRKI